MTMAFFAGGRPGIWEIILILVVVLILFGAKRLPELSRSLGKSLGEFKKAAKRGIAKTILPRTRRRATTRLIPSRRASE